MVIAAALDPTTRTSYQRVTLAGILLVAIIVGIATFRSFGVQRRPSPKRSPQGLTRAGVAIPMLRWLLCYAGKFAVVPPGDDRGNFLLSRPAMTEETSGPSSQVVSGHGGSPSDVGRGVAVRVPPA